MEPADYKHSGLVVMSLCSKRRFRELVSRDNGSAKLTVCVTSSMTFAKDRGTDPHDGSAFFDGYRKIVGHTHREFSLAFRKDFL